VKPFEEAGRTAANTVSQAVPLALLGCLQPLAVARVVEVWGADSKSCAIALGCAASVRAPHAPPKEPAADPCDLAICVDPDCVPLFLDSASVGAALDSGGVVAAWSRVAQLSSAPNVPHLLHYRHRAIIGGLLRDTGFSNSRLVALHHTSATRGDDFHLFLWSRSPLRPLTVGLHESTPQVVPPAAYPRPMMPPAPRKTHADAGGALASRLLCVEDRTLQLRSEIRRLKSQQVGGSSPQQSFFDVPRLLHPWPLAEEPAKPQSTLNLYDRRPDDLVIVEAQRGVTFMKAHGLHGEAPDFAAAVTALNEMPRTLVLDEDHPAVSIVVPVYGQLAWTLNALDSLFRHASRYSAEIIILDDCSPDGVTAEFVPQVSGIRYRRQEKNGGFIRSCNTGGEMARGDCVIMLNSDTRVVDGWLDAIIDSFTLFPKAGLIGSKMQYPDGSLQEAGGILWRDGGAWNYGRGDDPNRPQYCYARQVDYISGCSIALRTSLWRELKGFDPHFTPAYAEDADLCQRVLARGLEVWFQPASRVVHYEGKTSGTSTTGGVKAYQVINLKKLFLRWRSRFEGHRRNAEAPFFEKERHVNKRILFVDAVTPTPNQDAGSLQTVLGLRCSQARGYKAHFVPEDNWLYEPNYTPSLQREGVECGYAPYEVGFENYIRRYGFLFDVVVVYRVSVMFKCLPLLRDFAPNALVLFHLADLHYLRQQRQAQLEGDAAGLEAALVTKQKELKLVAQSDCTITHSTVEAAILADEVPDAPVQIWPLMIEVVGTRVGFEPRRDICFLGGYRHPPNVDAVLFFVKEVLPLIHAARPEIRFVVAGANPPCELLELASDSIIVTGMVETLADVFDSTRVFVCPLRVGAGAKGKVLSAMAHGVPVVSTAIGVEGAGLIDGEHVVVADTPSSLAASVLSLYEDPVRWQALSTAGLELTRREFSLEMGAGKLEEAIDKAYRQRLGMSQS
jgi:GT2 family glycosyltransferase